MNPITMKLVVDDLILQALREDITFEDVSTASVCPTARPATVELIAKADGIIAGLDVFARTFELLDSQSSVLLDVADGEEVHAGDHVGQVRGDARVLLSGERVALNYLQRMSGIATYTHRMAAALEGTKTVLVDTRKTTPGMRVFEKAAVEIGGGSNHRYNLSTAVMLKDNPHRCRRRRDACDRDGARPCIVYHDGRDRVREPGHGARGRGSRRRHHHVRQHDPRRHGCRD